MSKEKTAIEQPPRGARWLLALLRARDREVVRGDLEEEFHTRILPRLGLRRARRWYWGQTWRSLLWRWMPPARHHAELREQRKGDNMHKALMQDLRYGTRLLLRNPTFTVVAVLTLALGIGANTAIFSVLNGVVLQPPPYPDVDRVVMVYSTYEDQFTRSVISPGIFFDWREVANVFDAFSVTRTTRFIFTGQGEPEEVQGRQVSPDFFAALGIPPVLGRSFTEQETIPGEDTVIILSNGLWQRRFGGNKDILGKPVLLEGKSYTVVGIMPSSFSYPYDPQFWIPFAETAALREQRSSYYLGAIGRLKKGVTPEQASQALTQRLSQLSREYHQYEKRGGFVVPIHEDQIHRVKGNLWLLLGAVGFVLLIACANVANLLLVRATFREKEMALRRAVGAGRMRLVRQLLTESVLLAGSGTALGALLAWGGVQAFILFSPPFFPRIDGISLDLAVLFYAVGITLATGILFGLAPALYSVRMSLVDALKAGGRGEHRGSGGGRRGWLRQALVVAEVALALVLLVGAGLLVKSFATLTAEDTGFEPENLLMAHVSLPQYKYSEVHQQREFFDAVLERVASQPQVKNAALVNALPFSTWVYMYGITLPEMHESNGEPARGSALFASITPSYFPTVGIPLLRGRAFTEQEISEGRNYTVISESLATRHFGDENPIGKILRSRNTDWTIVGVVGDVRHQGLSDTLRPTFYVPFAQVASPTMMLVVRSTGPAGPLAQTIRGAVRAMDPDQPVQRIETVEGLISQSVATPRFYMLLLTFFAAIAASLAAVGIYGTMAYSVNQRAHEIGVRMALGAQHGHVLRLVLVRGLLLTGSGVALGLGASMGLTRYLKSLLYEVEATDPATFIWISALLLAASLLACYLPARRATRIDPMVALRYE